MEKYLQLETQLQKCENLDLYDHILEQQNQLGEASLVFAQSVGEEGRPVLLHAQVIADYATIREVFEMFCEHCDPKAP